MMRTSVTLSLFFTLSLITHTVNSFNITKMLDQHPDYTILNSYLTQTNLADEINARQTITLLAVENGNLSPVSGMPLSVLKDILSVHVVLDYYDVPKLTNLLESSTQLTTLFQSSGRARDHQGFLNVTQLTTGGVMFASAASNSTTRSNLVKAVASQPYNISVLQVSNLIVPEGMEGKGASPSPKASPKAPPPKLEGAPTPSRKVGPPPGAESPGPAADGPGADHVPEADKTHKKAGAEHQSTGFAVVFTVGVSSFYLASRI